MNLLKPIIVTGLTLALLAWLLPTVSYLNWTTLLIASVVLTLLQRVVRPFLSLLFLPINVVTLGLFSIVLNVALLWLATYLVPGFTISETVVLGVHLNQFFSLLFISVLIGLFQNIFSWVL